MKRIDELTPGQRYLYTEYRKMARQLAHLAREYDADGKTSVSMRRREAARAILAQAKQIRLTA